MNDALADRRIGDVFCLIAKYTGATQTALSLATGLSQPDVSAYMRGKRQLRDLAKFERVADGLGMPDHARMRLGLAPSSATGSQAANARADEAVPPSPDRIALPSLDDLQSEEGQDGDELVVVPVLTAEGVRHVAIPRRVFILGTAGLVTGTRQPEESPTDDGLARVTDVHLDAARADLRALFQMDDTFGGDAVRGMAAAHLKRMRRLRDAGSYAQRLVPQVHALVAQSAEHAAWLSFDSGRQDAAHRLFTEALAAAQLADDGALSVQVLAGMSLQAVYLDRGRDGLHAALRASSLAGPSAEPRLSSLLAVREARSAAVLHDTAGCRQALARAAANFDRIRDREPSWLDFHDEAEMQAAVGLCHADLGVYPVAVRAFREALSMQAPTYARNRALYRVRLADCLLGTGEPEEACATVDTVLDQLDEVSSARVRGWLRRFGRSLAGVDTPAAHQVRERLVLAGAA